MLGDSITEQGDWPSLLPAVPVVNQGHSGFTTAELVAEAETVAAAGPAAVFVLTGTNDIRDRLAPAVTVEHLSTILDRFADASPETTVVVQTVLPRSDAAPQVVETNAAIRALVADRGGRLLDLYPAFDDGSGALRVDETTDGVHLAEAGYRRWRGLLAETLTAIGIKPR